MTQFFIAFSDVICTTIIEYEDLKIEPLIRTKMQILEISSL